MLLVNRLKPAASYSPVDDPPVGQFLFQRKYNDRAAFFFQSFTVQELEKLDRWLPLNQIKNVQHLVFPVDSEYGSELEAIFRDHSI